MRRTFITAFILASAALVASAQTTPIGTGIMEVPYGYVRAISISNIGIFPACAGNRTSSGSADWPMYLVSIKIRPNYYVYSFSESTAGTYSQAQSYISTEKYNLVGEGTVQVPSGYTRAVSCTVNGYASALLARNSTSSSTYFPEYICSVNVGSSDFYYFSGTDSGSAYAKAVAYFQ